MLLFLDFDGVTHAIGAEHPFSGLRLANLAWALEGSDARIVIASRWRLEHEIDWLKRRLGPEIAERVIGETPQHTDPFAPHLRYQEIKDYLNSLADPSTDWIAVDDEVNNYPRHVHDRLILTDHRLGFTNADGRRLRALLLDRAQPSRLSGAG